MKSKGVLAVAAVMFVAALSGAVPASAQGIANIQVHGFVSMGYLYSGEVNFLADTEKGSSEFDEIGINFTAQPTDRLRLGFQLLAYDLGGLGNNDLQLDWAMADYKLADELGVRFGVLKSPLGFSHDQIDLDMTRTTIFLPMAAYWVRYRDVYMNVNGASLYGNLSLGPLGSLDYVGVAGNNSNFDPAVFSEDWSWLNLDVKDAGIRGMYGGRMIWNTPLENFLVGGSFLKGEDFFAGGDMPADLTEPVFLGPGNEVGLFPHGTEMKVKASELSVWYIFSQYSYGDLTLTGEVYRLIVDADVEASNDPNPTIAALAGFNGFGEDYTNYGGWYGMAEWRLTDWYAGAVTYSEMYNDWDDPTGQDNPGDRYGEFRRSYTLSSRFDITPSWNFKLEAHLIDGTFGVKDYLQDDPEEVDRYWNLYAAKTTFYF